MYSNILIPVVTGEGHDNSEGLRVAQTLAASGATFTLLHVMEPLPNLVSAEIPNEILIKAREEIAQEMSRLAETLPNTRVKLVSGHAGRGIIDFANQDATDCIIVASHRPDMSDYFLGSTAARVVRFAQCAVHVVR
jgi:universal stress protein F